MEDCSGSAANTHRILFGTKLWGESLYVSTCSLPYPRKLKRAATESGIFRLLDSLDFLPVYVLQYLRTGRLVILHD